MIHSDPRVAMSIIVEGVAAAMVVAEVVEVVLRVVKVMVVVVAAVLEVSIALWESLLTS